MNFTYVKDITAATTANALFTNVFCNYGSPSKIVSDRSTSFINELSAELFKLGSISHRCCSASNAKASPAESLAVRPFSSGLRSIIFGRKVSEIKVLTKYIQYVVNNLLTHPYKHASPFEMLTGATNGFYHPILEQKESTVSYSKFWTDKIKMMTKLSKFFADKYDTYLSQMRSDRRTVYSMGIKENEIVYVRIFKPKKDLKYLKSILPKFKLARVTKILGATSLILTDLDSGKSLSRNLADVYKVSHGSDYGNLYGDTLKANMEEIRETYHDLSFTKLPILDGRGKARLLSRALLSCSGSGLYARTWREERLSGTAQECGYRYVMRRRRRRRSARKGRRRALESNMIL